ncbi:MAG TPA: hydrolase [Geminicoccaceae bacterium]|nr:hydrolase [Geminicoccaceae bacterium]
MLLQTERSALLVVDIQERLAPAVAGAAEIIARTKILFDAATRLGVPIVVSEQYPKGLGGTDQRLRPLPNSAAVFPKNSFSCAREPRLRAHLDALRRRQVVVCGMETHVCVLQSALELQQAGYEVFACADAVGSRTEASKQLGLDRLRDRGVDVVNAEMVLFEWLAVAGTETFRELSRLIR